MIRLPILMYHHISKESATGLSISVENLEKQLFYLFEKNYKTYHFKDLDGTQNITSKRNIIITFDDAYVSQMQLALPLLKKYQLKATFFVPLKYIGKMDEWNTSSLDIMNLDQLKSLDPEFIELGFHSFYHKKYDELSNAEIEADTRRCMEFVAKNELNFSKVLAYPYGKFPKDNVRNEIFNEILKNNGIEYGLRIGNRINDFPFKNPYKIQRLDVKGEYSLSKFRKKIKRRKLF